MPSSPLTTMPSREIVNPRPASISQAISGVLSKWSLAMLFSIPGALVLLLTIWMAFHPNLKGFSESLSALQTEG